MDNIILGLLLLSSRTIYQLRDRIDKGMDLMYSSSMGSIQAAIKKLWTCGFICYEETTENGKYKKVYSITDSGKRYFLQWINSPFELQRAKNPELVKVYFMGFADKSGRRANVEAYLSHLSERYRALSAICEEGENMETTEANKEILFYQLASARYGREFIRFNIEWYKKLILEMEQEGLCSSTD